MYVIVELTQYERNALLALLSGGKQAARKLKRAQIPCLPQTPALATRTSSPASGSAWFHGLPNQAAFCRRQPGAGAERGARPGAERKLTGKEEALLVATACSSPPAGRSRWTLTLLADALVKLTAHESLSRETVRRRLAENDLGRGARTCGAFRRSTRNMSPAWKMCSISMPNRATRSGRWSASTKARSS